MSMTVLASAGHAATLNAAQALLEDQERHVSRIALNALVLAGKDLCKRKQLLWCRTVAEYQELLHAGMLLYPQRHDNRDKSLNIPTWPKSLFPKSAKFTQILVLPSEPYHEDPYYGH